MDNNNPNPSQVPNQDFLEQLLHLHSYASSSSSSHPNSDHHNPMILQLNNSPTTASGLHGPPFFPLGLSLDQPRPGFLSPQESSSTIHVKPFTDDIVDSSTPTSKNVFPGQPIPSPVPATPHQPAVRPRVRARRGQATDPHSIAERIRRERIAERIRALQELVPSVNKTDRAVMLDEIVDYVKFLRLQVKVLSMSRLGGAGAVVPLVTDIPVSSVEEEGGEVGQTQPVWEKWSSDGTEQEVAKLMEENVGAAMQFLQSKALCIMPISLASAIYHSQPPDAASFVKPETNPPP